MIEPYIYRLYNNYNKSLNDLRSAIKYGTPSIVDFGTTMINKRKCRHKRNRRK